MLNTITATKTLTGNFGFALRAAWKTLSEKMMDSLFPPQADTLKARLQSALQDYEGYIARKNAEAEVHERTVASLSTSIEEIDHEITEVEVFADVLKRLLKDL